MTPQHSRLLIDRLEAKGALVRAETPGRVIHYRAAVKRDKVRKPLVKSFLRHAQRRTASITIEKICFTNASGERRPETDPALGCLRWEARHRHEAQSSVASVLGEPPGYAQGQ